MKEISIRKLMNPTPKQETLLQLVRKFGFVLYGGAAGGGKSYGIRWVLLILLLEWYARFQIKGIEVGLFCEDYPSLRDRHEEKIQREFPEWLGKFEKSDMQFRLYEEYGGGILKLRNLDKPEKYQSSEFAAIAVDELTKNLRRVFDSLYHRRRWPGFPDDFIFPFFAGTNPGGPGHRWVKKLWIDKNFDGENLDPKEFAFLEAFATDNPHNPKSYINTLNQLPDKLRKALKDGDWTVFEGQFFTQFGLHLREDPFMLPDGSLLFGSLDYGESAPTSYGQWWIDSDKRPHRLFTYYKSGQTASDYAREIKDMIQSFHWTKGHFPLKIFADPSMWIKRKMEQDYSKSVADIFQQYGIPFKSGQHHDTSYTGLVKANNERVNGWRVMREFFNTVDGVPNSFYWSQYNKEYEEYIPLQIHDSHNSDDIDTNLEDHVADDSRYLFVGTHGIKPARYTQNSLNDYNKIVDLAAQIGEGRRDTSTGF